MRTRLAALLRSVVEWLEKESPRRSEDVPSRQELRALVLEVLSEQATAREAAAQAARALGVQGGNPAEEGFLAKFTGDGEEVVESIVKDDGGKVGIGTTSPTYKLTVDDPGFAGSDFMAQIRNRGGVASAGGLWVDTRWNVAENYILRLTTNSLTQEVLAVKGDGKVGIGTTNPQYALQVDRSQGDLLRLNRPGLGAVDFQISAGMAGSTMDLIVDPAQASSGFLFRPHNAANSIVNGLGIDRNGNVGIGTTSPSNKLHVEGGNVQIGSPTSDKNQWRTLLLAKDGPKQTQGAFGPEMITAAATNTGDPQHRRVVMWAGRADQNEAMFLLNSTGFLEWGEGGSFPFADQDSGLRRERRDPSPDELAKLGDMVLTTNGRFLVVRADPGSINARLDVNVGPFSKGFLESNGTNVSDGDTVTLGSKTYRFKNTLLQANDVKIGANAGESLKNLKAAIDLLGTPGTDYHSGTTINPDATVPFAYRNDTTGLKFRVDGKIPGANVPASTTAGSLSWTGLTSGNLTRPEYLVGINVPPGGGRGALDVRHIGTDLPTIRASQSVETADILAGFVETQPPEPHLRFEVAANGKLSWGPGSVLPDVSLRRFPATGTAEPKGLQLDGGDLYVLAPGKGIILKSPDGNTCRRVMIDNSGALQAAAITCP